MSKISCITLLLCACSYFSNAQERIGVFFRDNKQNDLYNRLTNATKSAFMLDSCFSIAATNKWLLDKADETTYGDINSDIVDILTQRFVEARTTYGDTTTIENFKRSVRIKSIAIVDLQPCVDEDCDYELSIYFIDIQTMTQKASLIPIYLDKSELNRLDKIETKIKKEFIDKYDLCNHVNNESVPPKISDSILQKRQYWISIIEKISRKIRDTASSTDQPELVKLQLINLCGEIITAYQNLIPLFDSTSEKKPLEIELEKWRIQMVQIKNLE